MLKRIFTAYLDSVWMPLVFFLIVWGGLISISLVAPQIPAWLGWVLFSFAAILFVGIIASTFWNFIQRRWVRGVAGVGFLICAMAIAMVSLMAVMFNSAFGGPSEDGFANGLTIPEGIELALPEPEDGLHAGGPPDRHQEVVSKVLGTPSAGDSTVTADIAALLELHTKQPELLRKYLTSSPAWRVTEEGGALQATRVWKVGGNWNYSLHGYYGGSDVFEWPRADQNFQCRVVVHLHAKSKMRWAREATVLRAGETRALDISLGNDLQQSICVISEGDLALEIFEQSLGQERRVTKATLRVLHDEFSSVLKDPSLKSTLAALDSGSTEEPGPSFKLRNGMQPGIYQAEIRVNPGEPGTIYLKAFEITKGTELSSSRLKQRTSQRVGWSTSPDELFSANSNFTIYEGDWGQPYAARFELWFEPDKGKRERKLMEKNFKIEGWQR